MERSLLKTRNLIEDFDQRPTDVRVGTAPGQDGPLADSFLDVEPVLLQVEPKGVHRQRAEAQLAQEWVAQNGVPNGPRPLQQHFRMFFSQLSANDHLYSKASDHQVARKGSHGNDRRQHKLTCAAERQIGPTLS